MVRDIGGRAEASPLDVGAMTLTCLSTHSFIRLHWTSSRASALPIKPATSTAQLIQAKQHTSICRVKAHGKPSCKHDPVSYQRTYNPKADLAVTTSPTRMNLTLTKQRLKGAQTGHSLLAKKRDALMNRFRAILRKVDEVSVDLLEDIHGRFC